MHMRLIFNLVTFLLTLLPEVVVGWLYAVHWPRWAQGLYGATIAWELLAIVMMDTWAIGHVRSLRMFLGTLLLLVAPKMLFALIAPLMGWPAGLTAAGLMMVAMLYGFTKGWRRLEVRRTTCLSPTLPEAFDGYRILQVSDLHLGTLEGHPEVLEHMVDTANAQQADLIVFTGDLVNHYVAEAKPFMHILQRLHAHDGVLAITGNHDYVDKEHWEELPEVMRQMGWHVLMNEHMDLRRNAGAIAVVGVESASPPPFTKRDDLPKALEGIPPGTWTIVLTHDPSHWKREVLHTSDAALTLSGHTHAGQMRLGSLSPARLLYREWAGDYHHQGRMLHVSQGISGTVPFRLGAWPELDIITLKKTT